MFDVVPDDDSHKRDLETWLVTVGYGPVDEGPQVRVISLAEARREADRERRRMERRFRSAPFPLYGLPPSWEGMRCLGGGGWSERKIEALSLVHGIPVQGTGPMLATETAEPMLGGGGGPLRVLAEEIWRRPALTVEQAVESLRTRWRSVGSDELSPIPIRGEAVITVEDASIRFATLAQPSHWVGRAEVDGYVVTLEGEDFPIDAVSLVRVTNIEPYVQGSRQFESG